MHFVADAASLSHDSTETFGLTRDRSQVDTYVRLLAESGPWKRIVHIGHSLDGSIPLLSELFEPAKFTAVAQGNDPGRQVNPYREARKLDESLTVWSNVDTTDRDVVVGIVHADHGSESLDLVVDDGRHSLGAVRTAFEVLFPRLRNGGRYVIEGWDWAHYPGSATQDRSGHLAGLPAVSNLMAELLGVIGTGQRLVSEVSVRHRQVEIVRGPALIKEPFTIEAHFLNRGLTFRPLL